MKKQKKKSLLIIILAVFAVSASIYIVLSMDNGYALEVMEQKSDNQIVKDFSTFTKNKSFYQYIDKKISIENQNNIFGDKYHDAEKFLNDAGIFDEELELHFTEDMLDELIDTGFPQISIMSLYYAVDESSTQKTIGLSEEEVDAAKMIQLSEQQVDKYFGEKYFGQKADIYKKVPILKKTVMASKVDMDYVRLQVWFDWVDMPSERNLDFVKIRIDNAWHDMGDSEDYGRVTAKHEYYKLIKDGVVGIEGEKKKVSYDMKEALSVFLEDGEYDILDIIVKAAVKLADNEDKLKSDGNVYSGEVTGESVFIDYYVRLISKNANVDYLGIEPVYTHVIE